MLAYLSWEQDYCRGKFYYTGLDNLSEGRNGLVAGCVPCHKCVSRWTLLMCVMKLAELLFHFRYTTAQKFLNTPQFQDILKKWNKKDIVSSHKQKFFKNEQYMLDIAFFKVTSPCVNYRFAHSGCPSVKHASVSSQLTLHMFSKWLHSTFALVSCLFLTSLSKLSESSSIGLQLGK